MSTKHEPVTTDLLREIADAFKRRDMNAFMSYFAEQCEFCMASGAGPEGRRVTGKRAIREALEERLRMVPDLRLERITEYVLGDRAVTTWHLTGTTKDGAILDWNGCDLWEFTNGRVTRKDTYWKVVRPV